MIVSLIVQFYKIDLRKLHTPPLISSYISTKEAHPTGGGEDLLYLGDPQPVRCASWKITLPVEAMVTDIWGRGCETKSKAKHAAYIVYLPIL